MLAPLLLLPAALALDVDTGVLQASFSGLALTSLSSRLTGATWFSGSSRIVEVEGGSLEPRLSVDALDDGELLLTLDLTNASDLPVGVDVHFPVLSDLRKGAATDLGYLFPARGVIFDDEVTSHVRYYGGLFPLQFMEIHDGDAGGLWMLTRDTTGLQKTYTTRKNADGADLEVEWPDLWVEAGQTLSLQASLGVHASDWHETLAAYQRWVRTWHHPSTPRNPAFREAFNLRQLHLNDNTVLGAHPGAFDPDTGTFQIQAFLEEDRAAFGGVDWVHIFDWGMDWIHGRVGDYNPWSYLGDPSVLAGEIDRLQSEGTGVDLYEEGYLLDTTSLVGLSHGDAWEMQTDDGAVYTNYAPSWHVCPGVQAWRDHFALRNGRRTERRVGASGLYLDQLGYGYQYPCYRNDHDHDVPSAQIAEETRWVQAVRDAVSPDQVLFTEAAPADVLTPYQDGAFTEAVTSFRDDVRTVSVHLSRFALPDFKTFELLTQDEPLGDDVEGVRLTFFNGEGQRLMGYLEDDDWFGDGALAEIQHGWRVLRTWRDAFTSDAPMPLVDTGVDGVYANLFPSDHVRLWTLIQRGDAAVSSVSLAASDLPGATWQDCWNDRVLDPVFADGVARLDVALAPGDVGCVVQTWTDDAPTLLAAWRLDEPAGSDTVADDIGDADGTGDGPVLGGESALPSRFGTAATFDGVDDAFSLGPVDALSDLVHDLSLSAWIRPDDSSGPQRILAVQGWTDGGLVFGLTDEGDTRAVVLTTVGTWDYTWPLALPAESWTHVAVTLDAGDVATLYVNGEPRGSLTASLAGPGPGLPTSGSWWIGSNGLDGFFDGSLDEIQVWKGVLSDAEIRALADVTSPMAGKLRVADAEIRDTDALELWWSGFHDAETGIVDHVVSLGSSEGAADLYGPASHGPQTGAVLTGLSLPDGVVWATVTAANGVGLSTTATASFTVDTAPPPLLGTWDAPAELSADLERTERFTVTAWIQPGGSGPMTVLGSDDGGWTFGLGGGDDLAFTTWGLTDYLVSTSLPTDRPTHVAVVFDRWSDATFYVDGVPAGKVYGVLPATPSTAGYRVGGGNTPFIGTFSDVRLYDGELDADAIAALVAPPDTGATADTAVTPETGFADTTVRDSASSPETGTGTTGKDCGCGVGGSRGGGWILGLAVLVLRIRRRRGKRRG